MSPGLHKPEELVKGLQVLHAPVLLRVLRTKLNWQVLRG